MVKASWGVLRSDRQLLVIPTASAIVSIILLLALLVAWVWSGGPDRLEAEGFGLVDAVLLFVYYLVATAVVVFFNAALVGAAAVRLDGGQSAVRQGFRAAVAHLPAIIGWSLITATVGLVLKALADRAGALGAVTSIVGSVAWTIVTFLVLPILVIEGVGPVTALRRSAELLRGTWGEQVAGTASIGLVMGAITLGVILIGGAITFLVADASGTLVAIALTATVLVVIVVALLSSALSGIFNVALYRYASGQESGSSFPQETLAGALERR
jgi:hypothetical protein